MMGSTHMRRLDDVLPHSVLQQLGTQFRKGVSSAVVHYPEQSGDEDSVTGGLIHAIGQEANGVDPATGYTWLTKTWKLRGRGKGAPEKTIGADMVLEVQVTDSSGGIVMRKSLPIQSKKDWTKRDPLLHGQAHKLSEIPGGGLVVDYTSRGYSAAMANVAAEAGGDRRRIAPDAVRPLGDVLADDFLHCRVGSTNVYLTR